MRKLGGNPEKTSPFTIETNNLTKKFGTYTAVDGLCMQVPKGCIYGFLGPNGSGKSTTIRMICGVLTPTSGTGTVMGYDIKKDTERVRQNIGYMSQKFGLYEDLTVRENLEFYGGVYGLSKKPLGERVAESLELAGLGERQKQLAGTLSGGWKQRLALGCAFIHKPGLLILDEPTAGVDPVSRRTFWTVIKGLARQGVTILVTTHYMDEAQSCDIVAFIFNGKLYHVDTPENIIKNEGANNLEDVFIKLVQTTGGE